MNEFAKLLRIKLLKEREWTEEECRALVDMLINGQVNDLQIGSLVTCVYLQDFSPKELRNWTQEMIRTSYCFNWPDEMKHLYVDKHSTGGVGDKISLVLVPVLVAQGLKVPMISGRSLGLTGGTLDKLESIPGFSINQSPDKVKRIIQEVGGCIIGQSDDIVPVDKVMYHTRNITGTVDKINLIASSILSKKAIEGISSLLLDIKFGSGALCQYSEAEKLFDTMLSLGPDIGLNVTCILSDMNSPLGSSVGNALEVFESIMIMRGCGCPDLMQLVVVEASQLMLQSGIVSDEKIARQRVLSCLQDHTALEVFEKILIAQGVSEIDAHECTFGDPWKVMKKATKIEIVRSAMTGCVEMIDARGISEVVCALMDQSKGVIDHSVGVVLLKSIGEQVANGEAWIEIHHNIPLSPIIRQKVASCLKVSEDGVTPPFRVVKIGRASAILK